MLHLFYNFKKTQETPNIWENKLPRISIGKTQNEEFHSYHDAPLNSPSIPSMALQDSTKGRNTQRRRKFHKTP
jgi:hypothetical protein